MPHGSAVASVAIEGLWTCHLLSEGALRREAIAELWQIPNGASVGFSVDLSVVTIGGCVSGSRVVSNRPRQTNVFEDPPSAQAPDGLPSRPGSEIARELGGRALLRYVDYKNVHEVSRDIPTFVTPTPYSVDEVRDYLALPRPELAREYVVL